MPARNLVRRFIPVFLSSLLFAVSSFAQSPDATWPNYGNDPGGTRYSSAHQIDRSNIGLLHLAWTYRTGAMDEKTALVRRAAF
jgi:glucose dehydrogenase